MIVPFLDLQAQYRQVENEVLPMLKKAMEDAQFVGGPNVEGFEQEFATFCNTEYCIGVNSGTDALRFALMASRSIMRGHSRCRNPTGKDVRKWLLRPFNRNVG